ncbi:MAG: hypothetical protein PUP92_30230 [Rhizonema sp. PD38]|nr:hypothetical protein [Rhizonema sp. PD38]
MGAIVSTLKLQDKWDEIVDEAKKQYEVETGKSKECADKEVREFFHEAEEVIKVSKKLY